jgi:fused signal recognition particle receptor
MFDFLKKKLQSFIGTDDKKTKKSRTAKKEKKAKEPKVKKEKSSKKAKQPTKNIETIKEQVTEVAPVIEEIEHKEEEKKEGFFGKLFAKVSSKKITEADFDELFYELELALLESNVALDVVDKIKEELKPRLIDKEIKKEKLGAEISVALKNTIEQVLHEPSKSIIDQIKAKEGPFVILFFGINGSGKTTTIAKLAHYLKKNNISCVLAAGDTFRAIPPQKILS